MKNELTESSESAIKDLFDLFKNIVISAAGQNSVVAGFFKTLEDKDYSMFCERASKLMLEFKNKMIEMDMVIKKVNYLIADESKYIHLRNFISFYFTKCDPALIETNIRIFFDYISEKYVKDTYDILLEKMCLLNKQSINVMKKIKSIENKKNIYEWKNLIALYDINQDMVYTQLLTSEDLTNDHLELAYGLKSLVDNDFITNSVTLYPGDVDVNNIDKFSLTAIGHLLMNYIDEE